MYCNISITFKINNCDAKIIQHKSSFTIIHQNILKYKLRLIDKCENQCIKFEDLFKNTDHF